MALLTLPMDYRIEFCSGSKYTFEMIPSHYLYLCNTIIKANHKYVGEI